MNQAPLSHHIADALQRGYRTIAYRDALQDDLIREAARTIHHLCRQTTPLNIALVTANREETIALKSDLARYGFGQIGRIGLNHEAIQVGSLERLDRRIAQGETDYSLIVLLANLDRDHAKRVLARIPAQRVIDLDPHAGPCPRPADHILYRGMSGDIETLDQAQISHMRH